MEFETGKETEQPSGISEAERLEASTRRVVITPVHSDITAEDLSDEVVATQHLVQPVLGNLPMESEVTHGAPLQQHIDKRNHRKALAISLITVGVVTGISLVAFLTVSNNS